MFNWNKAAFTASGVFTAPALANAPTADLGDVTTGGGLSFTAYVGTFDPNPQVTDIVQGEAKTITVAVQARGTFVDSTPTDITVKFSDEDGNVVTVENEDITRITENDTFQIIRFVVPEEGTEELTPGMATMEVSIDSEKVQIPDAIRIVKAL
jgi:hypothetical protein